MKGKLLISGLVTGMLISSMAFAVSDSSGADISGTSDANSAISGSAAGTDAVNGMNDMNGANNGMGSAGSDAPSSSADTATGDDDY